jgi:hypothetical protein
MKLHITELTDIRSPVALRRRGLAQLAALALALQLFHLTVAWLALPAMPGLPFWLIWAVNGFFGLVLLGLLGLKLRPHLRRQKLEPVRQVFLDALWLGVSCLAAIFAGRMGLELGAVLFVAIGLLGYGLAFRRAWLGLGKA